MDVGSKPSRKPRRGTGGHFALKVTGAYVLVALAWVLLFYRLLPVLIQDPAALELFTATRVLFTAAVLYLVTWFAFGRLRRAQQRIAHLNAVLRAIRGVNQLITREKDRDRLLDGASHILVSTLGYRSAWMLLLDDDGRFITAAGAGLGERSDAFLDRLRRGDYPDCVRRCLREKSEQVLRPPRLSCRDCPLEHLEPGSSAQVAPLLHQGRLFGVLALTLPVHVEPTAEEQSLVAEVAGDIAFALATLKAESEHRQAEENVATLKQQMEFVLGATKTGLDMIDSDLNIRFIDPEWQKVYGDPKGKKCYEYFMGRSEPCPNCGVLLALQTKQPAVTEEILVKEGARPIQVTTIPFQNERGEWLVAEVNVDITERKRAEAVLRESEERYRTTLDSMLEGCQIIGRDWRYLYLNDAAALHGRRTKAELLGQRMTDAYPGIEKTDMFAALRRCMDDGAPCRMENEFTYPDDSTAWFELSIEPAPEGVFILSVDVTKRKRAEEALRESEEELSAIFNSAPVAMVVVDAEPSVVAANKAAAALSGQPVRDMVGFRPGSALGCLNALATPEGCGFGEACQTCGLRQAVLDTLHTGVGHSSEEVTLPFQGPKGPDEHYLLVSTASIEAPAGRVALVCLKDVTQEKRAEREVVILARFPAENPHPILRVSTDGVVIYANRPAELLLNTIGCRSGDPLPEPYRSHVLEALASGARRDVEATFQDRTYVVTFAPIVEAGYANIYARDITDRKKVEEALRESEERYRALTEQSPTFVLILQGGQVRYANAAAVCAVGYTVEELGATPAFDFVHPQDRAQTQEAIEGAGLGESVEGVELRVLTKAGDVMWVQFSATRIDFEGQPAVLVNGVDITQLKHLEQQLFQSEKLTAIGELISGITHELNNPLAAVLGYAELAQEPGVESELAGYLEKIAEQAARASGIVGNLLVFARQKEPEREAVSLNAVVSSALDLRGYELRVSNIQMLTELDESLPYVQGDFQQLVQVVLNLINNAEHAIRKHQGTGTITLRTGTFHREGMPWVRLEVLDDGPGIPEPLLTRIFDPFFSTKGPGEGTGLGLSVSYGIVSAHQGFIYAENRPEGGARLVVELPAAEAPESAPPPEPKIPSVKPARILVVEDEEAVAAMLARLLRADGHEVSVAKEGREALARVEAEHFDLVVTDFKMPGMSGLEFYRSVAETHPGLAHRIIFTTGDVLSVDTRRFLAEVGAPVLCKPYGLDQARNVIYGKLQEGGT